MGKRHLPPLSALKAFEAFARTGRMIHAADELSVTHGAISRQLRLLQVWLETPLIEGPKSNLRLTAAGSQFASVLTRAFNDIEVALPSKRNGRQATLKVSCLGTFAMRWLTPRLPRFYNHHPNIAIEISPSYAPVDFRAGGYDVAIRMVTHGAPSNTRTTPFLRDFYGPVLAPTLLPENIDTAAICTLPRLHSKSYPQSWREWEERAHTKPAKPLSETLFDHSFYMLAAASAGLGTAIGLQSLIEDDLEAGALVAPLGLIELPQSYGFIQPVSQESLEAEAFLEWLMREGRMVTAWSSPPIQTSSQTLKGKQQT